MQLIGCFTSVFFARRRFWRHGALQTDALISWKLKKKNERKSPASSLPSRTLICSIIGCTTHRECCIITFGAAPHNNCVLSSTTFFFNLHQSAFISIWNACHLFIACGMCFGRVLMGVTNQFFFHLSHSVLSLSSVFFLYFDWHRETYPSALLRPLLTARPNKGNKNEIGQWKKVASPREMKKKYIYILKCHLYQMKTD